MENKIYNEQDDYYLPCLALPEEENQPICVWGQRDARYQNEHREPSNKCKTERPPYRN